MAHINLWCVLAWMCWSMWPSVCSFFKCVGTVMDIILFIHRLRQCYHTCRCRLLWSDSIPNVPSCVTLRSAVPSADPVMTNILFMSTVFICSTCVGLCVYVEKRAYMISLYCCMQSYTFIHTYAHLHIIMCRWICRVFLRVHIYDFIYIYVYTQGLQRHTTRSPWAVPLLSAVVIPAPSSPRECAAAAKVL